MLFGTTTTNFFGTMTTCLFAAVRSSVMCSVLHFSVRRRFAAGSIFGEACSSRPLFGCVPTDRGASGVGCGLSTCLAILGLRIVQGEVILGAGLSWPQIVMLSAPSVVFSTCVLVGVGFGVSSCHSLCDNCEVRCSLARVGGSGSANV